MKIDRKILDKKVEQLRGMDDKFGEWRQHFEELSMYILPHRYAWLGQTNTDLGSKKYRSKKIVNSTGTIAANQLAAGMMGGITSPAHQWFRLNKAGQNPQEVENQGIRAYLDAVQETTLQVLANSNFYSTIQTVYKDLGVFGTSAIVEYEDDDDVVRFYLSPLGEYRISTNAQREVTMFGRPSLMMTVEQVVTRFGEENVSREVLSKWRLGGANILSTVSVCHLIEPNYGNGDESFGGQYAYREFYWEKGAKDDLLAHEPYSEKPFFVPRWEVVGQDTYGSSPGMVALPDIIQLQHEEIRKAQTLDKHVDPPVVSDIAARRPLALVPGGTTFVPSASSVGVKPIYQTSGGVVGEVTRDLAHLEYRIREVFFNDLFKMISQLETVRSATEIDARMQEKLVLLGPVLQSFTKEVLDPMIRRTLAIMQRKQLIPPPPQELQGLVLRYSGVLQEAQKAATIAPIERFMQVVGSLVSLWPEVALIANPEKLVRQYADGLNVPAVVLRSAREVAQMMAEVQEQQRQQQSLEQGEVLTNAAKNLAGVDLGGGANALQSLLGGAR